MKHSKFKSIYNGLSSVAKKVYEAIPIQDAWDLKAIIAEMKRIFPSMGDQNVIKGCVNTLVQSGLVEEPKNGHFKRAVVDPEESSRPDPNLDKYFVAQKEAPPWENLPDATPLEKINGLQKIAARISQDVKQLSDAIETVAIEVEDQFSQRDAESQKLKQLQALLKSLA